MTCDDVRDRVIAIAQSIVGVSADPADPDSRQLYIDLIAPGETQGQQANLADNCSGCALVVAGIWRELGVTVTELDPPYRTGTAVSRLCAIARRVGAWVAFSAGKRPSPGDAVLVGGDPGGTEHIYTVISVIEDGTNLAVESVDGGQRDAKRHQTILAKQRIWKGKKDLVFTGSDPGAVRRGGRTIKGWIDVTRLPIAEQDAETEEVAGEAV